MSLFLFFKLNIMIFEIFWKWIYIKHREENWKNLKLTITEDIKTSIYSSIQERLTEWAICNDQNHVVWWWSTKNIYKNPLLIK